ncbi:MAG TPA: MBL fold metallo-hydrolase [Caulobacteraceae bacterium]|jgi:glyoxylase-like metal-dependent hydrolase (beta-lactamase superfamily II)
MNRTTALLAAACAALLAACGESVDDVETQAPAAQAPAAPAAAAPAPAAEATSSRRQVGEAQVTTILDGRGQFPAAELFAGITPQEAGQLLQAGGELAGTLQAPAWHATVQGFVVDVGGQRVLIDTGTGGAMMPETSGRLPANLAAAGITPESIQHIVISHFHGDHLGGVLAQGRARYPNATLHVNAAELSHWRAQKEGDAGALARQVAEAYGDKLKTFRSGEIVPGLAAEPATGHTPGHTVYRLTSGGQQMIFVGDLIHSVAIQTPRPQVTLNFDSDQNAARSARLAFLQRHAGQNVLFAGPHFPFPGIGRIEKAGEAYRYVPVAPGAAAAPAQAGAAQAGAAAPAAAAAPAG